MSQNPFEKIFNYQIITRLEETDSIAITAQERGWLKMMLVHPEAANAFTSGTLNGSSSSSTWSIAVPR